jgi:NifU-like protein involved in Fe-S cluster formation
VLRLIVKIGDDLKGQVFVTGYAKLPQGITASEMYSVICMGLLVDNKTGIIKDAECSLVTSLAKRVFKELVVGKNLNEIQDIEEEFVEVYYGSAKKSFDLCFKNMS